MNADRWKQVEACYHAAMERPVGERAAFLAQACANDPELRHEVQSLLDQQAGSFLESAPVSSVKTLLPGARLGNFEIVELIGRGGMGEVYRARDSRLKRDVAIKVLPAGLARDPDRIARFEREARAAGALNHPNIVAVHDIGRDDGTYWIATELVAGESLAKVIERGPLAVGKALDIAAQIADGLASAHAAGIVHRDLKPANIMVTRDSRVKILDFGLALRQRTSQDSTTVDMTDEGTVLGTAGYMSPEQVRGEVVDNRSDLFSFGVILYEMLGGKRAFAGASSVEVMHAILKEEPGELPTTVPVAFDRIVRRCLEKDRDRRFQTAADLGWALQALSILAPPAKARLRRAWWKWAALATPCGAAAIAAFLWIDRPLPIPRVTGIIQITRDNMLTRDGNMCPLLSDGSRLFFCANEDVPEYQASAKGGETVPITLQTKGYEYVIDLSHDGTEFLVCRKVTVGCELWAEPLLGGSPRRLGNIIARSSGAWSPDGQQLAYAADKELHLATRDGTEIRKLAKFSGHAYYLHWSPDGRRISAAIDGDSNHPTRLWEVSSDGKGAHQVLPDWNPSWDTSDGVWTPDGEYLIFISQGKIWAVRENGSLLQRRGGLPVELNIGLLTAQHPLPSADGKRLYFEGKLDRNEFVRYDLKSGGISPALAGISGTWLEFSKAGKWMAYVSVPQGTLFRAAPDGSQRLQLTWPPLDVFEPRWSPDGKEIAFAAEVPGKPPRIYVVPSEGGSPRQITNGEAEEDSDPSWSPDGSTLVFGGICVHWSIEGSLHAVDVRSGRVSTVAGSKGMWSPRWSPDGNFIAGIGGRGLVLYDVRTQSQIQLPGAAGGYPNWSADGEYLFFKGSGWWRLRMRDRKVELVSSPKGGDVADWGWFVLAPNDSLITTRSTGAGDVYALDLEIR